jgi:hypothetical protein
LAASEKPEEPIKIWILKLQNCIQIHQVLDPSNLPFKKHFRCFLCTGALENHCLHDYLNKFGSKMEERRTVLIRID